MKSINGLLGAVTWLFMVFPGSDSAYAQLPMAGDAEKLGYFSFLGGKNLEFGIATSGEILFHPLDRKGATRGFKPFAIYPRIVEIRPDNENVSRRLDPESLESSDKATAKLEKTSFRGKANNDAVMEVTVESSRGVFLLGGKLLDIGKSKNPQRIGYMLSMVDVYRSDIKKFTEIQNEKEKQKALKEFEKKNRGDRISLKLADGRRLKCSMLEPIKTLEEQLKGTPIEHIELEYTAYPDHKFLFTAEPGSEITLTATGDQPLHLSLSIFWIAHPEKDPEGKARLAMEVK
jgi:hypothetical protein